MQDIRTFDVRLRLSDIIYENNEKLLMTFIPLAIKNLPIRQITFWHNGEVTQKDISYFNHNWLTSYTSNGIRCRVTDRSPTHEHAWFDIVNERDQHKYLAKHRFKFLYPNGNRNRIISGVVNYGNLLTFFSGINHKLRRKSDSRNT